MRSNKFARHEEHLEAKLWECQVLPGFLKAIALKCGDQIVRKTNDFQVERVVEKDFVGIFRRAKSSRSSRMRRSMVARPPIIEAPYASGSEIHIGYPHAIDVTPQRKECIG